MFSPRFRAQTLAVVLVILIGGSGCSAAEPIRPSTAASANSALAAFQALPADQRAEAVAILGRLSFTDVYQVLQANGASSVDPEGQRQALLTMGEKWPNLAAFWASMNIDMAQLSSAPGQSSTQQKATASLSLLGAVMSAGNRYYPTGYTQECRDLHAQYQAQYASASVNLAAAIAQALAQYRRAKGANVPPSVKGSGLLIRNGLDNRPSLAGPQNSELWWPEISGSSDYLADCFATAAEMASHDTVWVQQPDEDTATVIARPEYQ